MITFEQYPHIQDLILHYAHKFQRQDILDILTKGINNEKMADIFSRFIWQVAEAVNNDEENAIEVMGSLDNTEMLPDLSYETTKIMKSFGFYSIWEKVSEEEMR